ncbi:hypothetical protein HaLaN_02718, partial [Haematococcus lacustris]
LHVCIPAAPHVIGLHTISSPVTAEVTHPSANCSRATNTCLCFNFNSMAAWMLSSTKQHQEAAGQSTTFQTYWHQYRAFTPDHVLRMLVFTQSCVACWLTSRCMPQCCLPCSAYCRARNGVWCAPPRGNPGGAGKALRLCSQAVWEEHRTMSWSMRHFACDRHPGLNHALGNTVTGHHERSSGAPPQPGSQAAGR